MTWAVEHPNQRRWSRRTATSSQSGTRVWVRPIGAAEVGLLAALVGAWGAISVFVGPDFGYRPTSAGSWVWTTQNWLLHLLPGAVAVAAGLMILSASPSRRHAGTGAPIGLAALMIIASGAWFVIGPALWATFEPGQPFATGTTAWTSFLNQLGSSLGPGILLAVLGGMALKAVMARPAATVEDVPVEEAAPMTGREPAVGGEPVGRGGMARDGRIAEDERMADDGRLGRDERMADDGRLGRDERTAGDGRPARDEGMAHDERMAHDEGAARNDRIAGEEPSGGYDDPGSGAARADRPNRTV